MHLHDEELSDGNNSKTPTKATCPSPSITPHKDAAYQTKRKRSETELWKRNVRKRNRNAGLHYISTKGKEVPKKLMTEVGCKSCKLKCDEKITKQERQNLFDIYWGLQDYRRQRDFICQNVIAAPPKRTSGHKSTTYTYYVTVRNSKIKVCRTFFLNTFAIGEKDWSPRNAKESSWCI